MYKPSPIKYPRLYNRGQAVLILVIILLGAIIASIAAIGPQVGTSLKISRDQNLSKQMAALADLGIEDMVYRLDSGLAFDTTEQLTFDNGVVDVTVNFDEVKDTITINSIAESKETQGSIIRTKEVVLARGTSASLGEAVQAGAGGVTIADTAEVFGSIFANASVVGSGNSVTGDVALAGSDSQIESLGIDGNALASSIASSVIDGDAHYTDYLTSSLVEGSSQEILEVAEAKELSITEGDISHWQEASQDGLLLGNDPNQPCPYVIQGGGVTVLGPATINCDLIIEVGPGDKFNKVLSREWPEKKIISINKPEDIKHLLEVING